MIEIKVENGELEKLVFAGSDVDAMSDLVVIIGAIADGMERSGIDRKKFIATFMTGLAIGEPIKDALLRKHFVSDNATTISINREELLKQMREEAENDDEVEPLKDSNV